MPKNYPKSPELIQAQAASFASEELRNRDDIESVFAHMGATALEIKNTSPIPFNDYLQYLRTAKKENPAPIEARAELLRSYDEFEQPINKLLEGFNPDDVESRKQHPSHLGSGLMSDCFLLIKDGKKYVARIPRSFIGGWKIEGTDPNPAEVNDYLTAGIRGKGIPHLEQFVAASYEKGVTVSEFMPGIPSDELSMQDRSYITDAQLEAFAEALLTAKQAGILSETENPGNLLYDKESGFGLIDYDAVDSRKFKGKFGGWKQTPEDVANSIIRCLTPQGSISQEEQKQADDLSRRIKSIFLRILSEEAWGESHHFPEQ